MLNKNYVNINKSGYFNRYGIFYGTLRGFFTASPFHLIKDYETKKVLWQRKARKKIKKYLKFKDTNPENLNFPDIKIPENPIWFYWNKGIKNAPDIVKKCYDSIKKYSDQIIIVLDDENICNYVRFPEYITEKVKNGNISVAAYSDLLRFTLLEHYGGTWIDSTVYLTGSISPIILESDFFALRNSMGLVENPVLYPAWFLHAKKENNTIKQIRNIAYYYWLKEKHVIEYLLPNLIITEIINNTQIEEEMPYMSTDYSEVLIKKITDRYNEEEYKWIISLTNIHKLSYKLKKDEIEGTFYDKIINTEL